MERTIGKIKLADYIEDLGFKPPRTAFRKTDPRGEEYGEFEITLDKDLLSNDLCVTKLNEAGSRTYSMYFKSRVDLKHWARDCT